MKLIVGLGNPGKKYAKTRHNLGCLVIDKLCKLYQTSYVPQKKLCADIGCFKINQDKILLAKPQTFMNDSGQAVRKIVDFYRLPPNNLIIVHDDKDIAAGKIKIQYGRGPAGHNGVKSIIAHLRTQDFWRVRVGIAIDELKKTEDAGKFVLNKFNSLEQKKIKQGIEKAIEEIKKMIAG